MVEIHVGTTFASYEVGILRSNDDNEFPLFKLERSLLFGQVKSMYLEDPSQYFGSHYGNDKLIQIININSNCLNDSKNRIITYEIGISKDTNDYQANATGSEIKWVLDDLNLKEFDMYNWWNTERKPSLILQSKINHSLMGLTISEFLQTVNDNELSQTSENNLLRSVLLEMATNNKPIFLPLSKRSINNKPMHLRLPKTSTNNLLYLPTDRFKQT